LWLYSTRLRLKAKKFCGELLPSFKLTIADAWLGQKIADNNPMLGRKHVDCSPTAINKAVAKNK